MTDPVRVWGDCPFLSKFPGSRHDGKCYNSYTNRSCVEICEAGKCGIASAHFADLDRAVEEEREIILSLARVYLPEFERSQFGDAIRARTNKETGGTK